MSQPFANQPVMPPPGGQVPPNPYAQAHLAPPPQQKSRWWMWLLGGCGCSTVLLLLCCGGVSYWGYSKSMNVLGDLIKKDVADNADVKEQLGEDLSITMNFADTAKEKQARGGASNWLVFDAEGDKGSGQFIAEMPPGGNNGNPISKIDLKLPDGKIISIK